LIAVTKVVKDFPQITKIHLGKVEVGDRRQQLLNRYKEAIQILEKKYSSL
jgi:hypothetical protein